MPFTPDDRKHVLYLKIPLRRVGECNSCVGIYKQAWCCSDQSAIEFTTGVMDDDMIEFMNAKGITVDKDKRAHFSVRQTCPQYDWDTKKCKIWPTRPKICQKFPVHFIQIWERHDGKPVKTCSYDWDWDESQGIGIDLIKMTEVLKLG